MFRAYVCTLFLLAFGASSNGQTEHPAERKVLVEAVLVSGIRAIDTMELNEITNSVAGRVVADDVEELKERLRLSFQDHGYFDAKITSLRTRTSDPLANPKPVTVEAEVTEGNVFRIGEIRFSGNHAVTSDELRAEFPFRTNDVFHRSKTASGFESIQRAYERLGYVEFFLVPDVKKSSATTADIVIAIHEGPQYRMGSLQLVGDDHAAQQLYARWDLGPGQVFNAAYIQEFLDVNRSLFPASFGMERVAVARNCREHTVTVLMNLDPKHLSPAPKEVGCDKNTDRGSR